MEKIKDKRTVITGATGTIGSKTAKMLADSGAILYICGRNEDKLKAVAAECRIPAERIFVMDMSKDDEVIAVTQKISEQAGHIDILINAAGIGIIKNFENITADEFRKTIDINLVGTFLLIKGFINGMKENKKGLIINIPGILGKTPMAGAAAYAASKYGLNGMMKSLREELKRTDIRITQLFLGGADTDFWNNIDLRVQREKMIMAEEAARAIWFLCQQPVSGVVSEMVIQPFNHQAI